MKPQISRFIFLLFLSVVLFQCNFNKNTNSIKFHPNDPFKNTIVASQKFNIDSKKDNVIEGKNGTIIVCPIGCFKNSKGEIVEGNVSIELSEALLIEDMLLSNLTTTSNGELLETDGMIYFNATSNGEQLAINKDNPIHVEIPTTEKKAGMMVFKGIRDEKGNMNWIEPKELDNNLVIVDINSLDFLPQGFQAEVDNGMPYKNYKIATQSLTDSLYYQFSMKDFTSISPFASVPQDFNEPYYNKNKQIVNGKYTSNSYYVSDTIAEMTDGLDCILKGIDPAIIKVIKSEKYQNTFIATREFEVRLKVIFKTCNNAVIETYINNLNKNLYEVDSMAAIIVGENEYRQKFVDFSQQRLTKVKQADKYADLLKKYYEKQLAIVKSDLKKEKAKLMKELAKKNQEAKEVTEDYKKLLWKREKYRMETYGFNWSETGWINIDKGTVTKDWYAQPLEITVSNGKQFDRVHTYVVYTSIKSLYRLNTTDKALFYVGNDLDKKMLMPKKELGVAIAIGYKNEEPSLAIKEFKTGSEPKISFTLLPSSIANLKDAIRPYEKYAKENTISKDLEFMGKIYKEELRQNELAKEIEFMIRLRYIALPCCIEDVINTKD